MENTKKFEIIDEKVICKEGVRIPINNIILEYLKIKAPVILFTLILAYLVYQAIVEINEISIKLQILSFVIFSIILFWFLNKKPKK